MKKSFDILIYNHIIPGILLKSKGAFVKRI